MENLMVFLLSFTFIFIIYLIIYLVKKHKGTLRFMKEFSLLTSKYKLNRNNLDYNKLGLLIIFLNTLIISVTGTLCTMVKMNYIWQLCIGFVLLMILIYVVYGILGKVLKNKEKSDYIEINEGKKDKDGNDKHRKNRKKVAR
jgi:heme/copper-type cytochrome/quinol oxidase subunit 3